MTKHSFLLSLLWVTVVLESLQHYRTQQPNSIAQQVEQHSPFLLSTIGSLYAYSVLKDNTPRPIAFIGSIIIGTVAQLSQRVFLLRLAESLGYIDSRDVERAEQMYQYHVTSRYQATKHAVDENTNT